MWPSNTFKKKKEKIDLTPNIITEINITSFWERKKLESILITSSPKCLTFNLSFIFVTAFEFSSVAQYCPTLQHHGLQHARPPCPSPAPGVHSNSCPLSQWCHPLISSSVVPFSSSLQYFPASGSFQMSQFFASHSQSIGVSASVSVLPMNTQDWSP